MISYQECNDERISKSCYFGIVGLALLLGGLPIEVGATEPCGEFGECKVLIEINSTDGDIGFHWLVDGDDLNSIRIDDPDGAKVYENKAFGPLRDQKLTETFGESAEPICSEELREDEDEIVVTVADFVARWASGVYAISGSGDGGDKPAGATRLSHYIPAAPDNLALINGTISWTPGSSLGACASEAELVQLVADGVLPIHPAAVPIVAWELVLEVEDGSGLKFSTRLPPSQTSVTIPAEFLGAVAFDTPAKIEIGAIGGDVAVDDDDNATFTELVEICLNEVSGCEFD